MFAICVEASAHLLPAGCGAVAEVTGEIGSRLRIRVNGESAIEDVVADGVSLSWSESVARALAPLRDDSADAANAPPTSCRLLDVLELEPPTAEAVLGWWDRAGRTTYAPIGAAAEGRFGLDLKKDGPHALVAGTTGAGKSELLQTIIASLAVANRPTAMTFVLIDYKGGAAFKDCIHLPHTVGMVTDLDGHLTERALQSLNAELKRREHLLGTVGAKDIEDYWDTIDTPDHRTPGRPRPDAPS
jgi:S-DNA-T family DNA segregation ATPase FtsK/SpoIIIE